MGLGLRYCPNHPDVPLTLVSKRNGTYWRCEHESGCAHTENALTVRSANRVVAINGKSVSSVVRDGRRAIRSPGGSTVERDAMHRESDQ